MNNVIEVKTGESSIGIPIECKVYDDGRYTIEVNGIIEEECILNENMTIDDVYNGALVIGNCKYGIKTEEEYIPTSDDILAEILLGQAEIIANQSAQDEVLAEMLLNSLEV